MKKTSQKPSFKDSKGGSKSESTSKLDDSKSNVSTVTYKNWKDQLLNTPLVTDDFNYESLFIVESNPQCFTLIDGLIEESENTEQSVLRVVTSDNVQSVANGTASVKNVGSDLLTLAKKAMLDSKLEMKKNGTISTETEALLIKLIMLVRRGEYLSHKGNYLELQKAIEEEYALMNKGDTEVEKGKGKKGKEKKDKKADKKGKGKSNKGSIKGSLCDDINKTVYANTADIRKRMKNLKQTEDFKLPEEGIDFYFAFTKVYNYELIEKLAKIDVKVSALVDVSMNEKYFSTNVYHKTPFESNLSLDDVRQIDISNFWRACGIAKGNTMFRLSKDTPYIRYCPTDLESCYNDMCRIAKSINDLRRLHNEYLLSLRVLDVKETKPPIKLRKMITYNNILDKIPNELQSVPVILHALIEEVASRVPDDVKFEETKKHTNPYENFELHKIVPPKKLKRHYGARNQLLELFKKFEREKSVPCLPKEVTICKTKIIPYGNALEYQLSHAPFASELKQINIDSMKTLTPLRLFNFCPQQKTENVLIYDYLFHRWAKEFEITAPIRLMHCIHAYLFRHGKFFDPPKNEEYLPKVKVDDILFSDIKPYNDFEDKPLVFFTYLLSKGIRKCAKILDNFQEAKFETVKYCEHYEEYDPETMIQMVYLTYQFNPHYEYKYFPGHDTILLRFTHIKEGQSEPGQLYYIRTPLCFRDFCGHTLLKDTDWLFFQEFGYWKTKAEEKIVKETQTLEELYQFDEKDFIVPGSIKDRLLKEKEPSTKGGKGKDKKGKTKGSKTASANPSPKGSVKSKVSGKSKVEETAAKLDTTKIEEVKKVPNFEGYNLDDVLFQLFYDTQQWFTSDGYKIEITKYKWTGQSEQISIKNYINDNYFVFNLSKQKGFLACKPFNFQLFVVNGIIMRFELPPPPKTYVYPCNKRIATYFVEKNPSRNLSTASMIRAAPARKRSKPPTEGIYLKNKKEVLEHIKTAAQQNFPVFKICSTRLHKFLYVKRIKSHIELPIGKVIQRLTFKPKIFSKPDRQYTICQSIPAANVDDSNFHEVDLIWKASLPTGLYIQASQGPKSLYIKQGYIIDRDDMKSIENEDYRCIIRGKVLSFRKNGEVITMYFDKVWEQRQYGYFSSNATKNSNIDLRKLSNSTYCIHKAVQKTTRLERKIKKICKRLLPHLIDLSTNYRLESKHETLRKEKLVCKLSKKLYEQVPSMLPLLKLVTIQSDGSRIITTTKTEIYEEKKYFITSYNDYLKRETLLYREDGTTWYLDNKGYATTQFPDSTRITTWATKLDDCFYVNLEDSFCDTDQEEQMFEGQECGEMLTEEDMYLDEQINKFRERIKKCSISTSKDSGKPDATATEPFVLYGINYKYEHPNYMTVIEDCTDDIIEIKLPDEVNVKVFQDGTYNVQLPSKEVIEIGLNNVRITGKCCSSCKEKTRFHINTRPLYYRVREDRPNDNFIQLYDIFNKIIKVDFRGCVKEETIMNEHWNKCYCKKESLSRYFVLRRDLSGAELFVKPKTNRFLCILDNFEVDVREDDQILQTSIHLMKHLYKTYTEHLMMLYDLPLLGMLNNFTDSEEIFKVFDFDEKSIIHLRTPLYLLERKIYHLGFYKYVRSLASGFHYFLNDTGKKLFKPSQYLINFIDKNVCKESELETKIKVKVPAPVVPPKRSTQRDIAAKKKLSYKTKMEEKLKLLQEPIPKYFDSREGFMFVIINSCIEKAFRILKDKEGPSKVEKKSQVEVKREIKGQEEINNNEKGFPKARLSQRDSKVSPKESPTETKVSGESPLKKSRCSSHTLVITKDESDTSPTDFIPVDSAQVSLPDSNSTSGKISENDTKLSENDKKCRSTCRVNCRIKSCTSGCRPFCPINNISSSQFSFPKNESEAKPLETPKNISEKQIASIRMCKSVCELSTCPERCLPVKSSKTESILTDASLVRDHQESRFPKGSVYCTPIKCCPDPPNTSETSLFCERVDISSPPKLLDTEDSFHEDALAVEILQSLKNASYTKNIDDLTKKQIQTTLNSLLKYAPLNKERAKTLKNEILNLLGMEQQTNKVFNSAMKVIEEVKQDVALEEDEKDVIIRGSVSLQKLDELALTASIIMYNLLDTTDGNSKINGVNAIMNLLKKNRLSKDEKHTVLEMTAQSLVDDLKGSKYVMGHGLKELIPTNPLTAKLIIDTFDEVTNALLERNSSYTHFKMRTMSHKRTLSNIIQGIPQSRSLSRKDTKYKQSITEIGKDDFKILHDIQKRRSRETQHSKQNTPVETSMTKVNVPEKVNRVPTDQIELPLKPKIKVTKNEPEKPEPQAKKTALVRRSFAHTRGQVNHITHFNEPTLTYKKKKSPNTSPPLLTSNANSSDTTSSLTGSRQKKGSKGTSKQLVPQIVVTVSSDINIEDYFGQERRSHLF